MSYDHVFDRQEYQNIEVFHYIMYLYIVNHMYDMHEINQLDKSLDHDQDVREMNEYNLSI